uniref:Putative extracellular protein sel-1 n=1 Tax=Triatoma dimidiata TaxID=72491 RepID=A0A0V0G378_TRIDM
MWKFFSRGVRETLERGFRIIRPSEKTVKNDCTEHTTYCRKFSPCFLEPIYKYRCANNEDPKRDKQKSTPHDKVGDNTLLGVVSCSSVLALGWFLTQPCHWRKWWCQRDRDEKCKKPQLIRLLGKVANNQPINVGIHTDSTLAVNSTDDTDVTEGVPYGPKTAEEVLNEAAEEFRAVHESVVASAENSRGVDYISAKRHREAIVLFRSASRRGYAPAAYNLAQCYEMGLGTKQDFKEAAKWYRVAADKGHATAKYNLGVFYAHGWGGLEASNKTARKLFEEAAELGQPDANAALGLNSKNKDAPLLSSLGSSEDWGLTKESSDIKESSNKVSDANELYKMALSYESSVCEDITATGIVLQLHKMASDMGHAEAKARFQLLEGYEAIGLLQEFLCGKRRSDTNFFIKGITPAIVL